VERRSDLDRIIREALEEDDMFTEEDRRRLNRVYDHLVAYVDLSGPDVETGQTFDPETVSRC
jgi:hypothetical protein